jgi:hypothetical protein
MTVSSTANRVVYSGNAATTSFPFAFKVQSPADLVVIYTDATGTDFTLSPAQYGAAGFGLDAGGTVTYPVSGAPIAVGTSLTIYRNVAVTQPAAISNQGAMWPSVIESALDRATYILQRVADSVSRALVISPTDSGTLNPLPNATQRANSVLGFDGTGQPYAAQLIAGLGSASAWLVANFFPTASAAAARGALGAAGLVDNNVFTGNNTHDGVETFANAINEVQGVAIASASGVNDIGAATGNYVHITGTNTITGLGAIQAGTRRKVVFDGALILTHNATSLICLTGTNILTAAGDIAEFESEGSGNWRMTSYERAKGVPLATGVATPIYVFTSTNPAGTTALPVDNTTPQITEGNLLFSQAFTALNAAHRIRIEVTGTLTVGSVDTAGIALFMDGGVNAISASPIRCPDGLPHAFVFRYEAVQPAGAHTYSVRVGANSGGAMIINGQTGAQYFNGLAGAALTIEELPAP